MVVGAAVLCLAAPSVGRADGTTERVSVSSREAQGNARSIGPAISGDGRFAAFLSDATNLVPGDTNAASDVFVRDLRLGRTSRVSLRADGGQGNGRSGVPSISGDGRFVAFVSDATNLVPGDTNGLNDIFVRDRHMGTTIRATLGPGGRQPDGPSLGYALARNGHYVAFASFGTNLVPGDTNATNDVFVRDLRAGVTRRASVGAGGAQGNDGSGFPAISADGRFVVFNSAATNLVAGDTNGRVDVFVRDRRTRTTTRVNLGPGGVQANGDPFAVLPAISADGRFVAFTSLATNLVRDDTNAVQDVFVRDRQRGETLRVSVGPDGREANGLSFSTQDAISGDGRFVTFVSDATNLVPGDTNAVRDVFVRDLRLGRTSRVSLRADGGQGNGVSGGPFNAISADGRFVAFFSDATNLVRGDTNDVGDVFVRDRGQPR